MKLDEALAVPPEPRLRREEKRSARGAVAARCEASERSVEKLKKTVDAPQKELTASQKVSAKLKDQLQRATERNQQLQAQLDEA